MQNWRGIVYEHSSSLFRDLSSPFLSSILFLYLLSIVLSFSASIFFLRFSHLYFSFSLSHTHARVPLTDEVQRTRERGACAGLHDCRNCRYAAKVEGVQRQPCARLLSVFLSVFFPPPFSFFFSLHSFFFVFFSVFFFFHKKVMVHSCSDKISKKRSRAKKNSHPYATDTHVIVSSFSQCLSHEFFASALTYRRNTETRSCYHGFNIRRFANVRVECER